MTRAPGSLFVKDPDSTEPIGVDWTAYLAELGASVTIVSSIWVITGPDAVLTQASDAILAGNLKTQVYLSGGTLGFRYTVTNRITTNSSPAVVDDRSVFVLVQQQ